MLLLYVTCKLLNRIQRWLPLPLAPDFDSLYFQKNKNRFSATVSCGDQSDALNSYPTAPVDGIPLPGRTSRYPSCWRRAAALGHVFPARLHREAKQWRPQRRCSRPSAVALPNSPAASRPRLSPVPSTRRQGCGRF